MVISEDDLRALLDQRSAGPVARAARVGEVRARVRRVRSRRRAGGAVLAAATVAVAGASVPRLAGQVTGEGSVDVAVRGGGGATAEATSDAATPVPCTPGIEVPPSDLPALSEPGLRVEPESVDGVRTGPGDVVYGVTPPLPFSQEEIERLSEVMPRQVHVLPATGLSVKDCVSDNPRTLLIWAYGERPVEPQVTVNDMPVTFRRVLTFEGSPIMWAATVDLDERALGDGSGCSPEGLGCYSVDVDPSALSPSDWQVAVIENPDTNLYRVGEILGLPVDAIGTLTPKVDVAQPSPRR